MAKWIKKTKTNKQKKSLLCLQEIHFRSKDTHRLKYSKRYSNQVEKKNLGHSIPISDKEDITTKSIVKDRRTLKGSMQEENIMFRNIYGLNMLMFLQTGLTFCDLMDCTRPGSSVSGILQARILVWVAIAFSRGSSWTMD